MVRLLALLLLLSLPGLSIAQEAPQGEVRFFASVEEPVWVGQELELYLELWSDGFSFSGQSFVLPDVPGGFLLQTDSATVKLSESREGQTWQGLRYVLLFYPQRAGRFEVPAFEVRFSASAGFGTEATAFAFRTEPLQFAARQPPGAEAGGLLVTTTSFTLEANWSRTLPDGGPLTLQTGDALTLELRRSAADVPGMVLAPLDVPEISGLGVYASRPVVRDSANRGVLTGERRDTLTFVCEAPGRYEIPGWRLQWWDPEREVLEEQVIPGVELEVAANPLYAATAVDASPDRVRPWRLLAFLAAALALGALAWRYRSWIGTLAGQLRQKITRPAAGRSHSGTLQPLNPRSSR